MKSITVIAAASLMTLAGCGASHDPQGSGATPSQSAGTKPEAGQGAGDSLGAPSGTAAAPLPSPSAADLADKGEKGARAVLLNWARALERRDFALAWDQFGNPPSTRQDYEEWWSRYRTITVAVPEGTMDAAMGSLYYAVHATLTGTTDAGKPFRLEGDVILRRVNDVDGATPAQLRWHIESADLKNA